MARHSTLYEVKRAESKRAQGPISADRARRGRLVGRERERAPPAVQIISASSAASAIRLLAPLRVQRITSEPEPNPTASDVRHARSPAASSSIPFRWLAFKVSRRFRLFLSPSSGRVLKSPPRSPNLAEIHHRTALSTGHTHGFFTSYSPRTVHRRCSPRSSRLCFVALASSMPCGKSPATLSQRCGRMSRGAQGGIRCARKPDQDQGTRGASTPPFPTSTRRQVATHEPSQGYEDSQAAAIFCVWHTASVLPMCSWPTSLFCG
jgi:hypothetical protein